MQNISMQKAGCTSQREYFDLFYPSYGDTLPDFNGSVGMTFEQAGHGVCGREPSQSAGDTLEIRLTVLNTIFDHQPQHHRSGFPNAVRISGNSEIFPGC